MIRSYLLIVFILIITLMYSCETPKVAQKQVEEKEEIIVPDDLILNLLDSVDVSSLRYDASGDGLFGRKIIYRDMSAAKSATTVSGKVKIKLCINRNGIVKYAEILQDSSTIKHVQTLKKYVIAATGYKFQPSVEAPQFECGTMSFRIDNSRNNRLR